MPRTRDGDETLVQLIARHPALYDSDCKEYKDARVREDAWRVVARGTDRSAEDCKKRWRDIRDHYYKIKRNMSKTGSVTSFRPPKWNLYESLSFLDGLRRERRLKPPVDQAGEDQHTGPGEDDSAEEAEVMGHVHSHHTTGNEETPAPRVQATTQSADPHPAKKPRVALRKTRLHSTIINEYEKDPGEGANLIRTIATEDDIDAFFRSIALTVKKFPPNLIGTAKLKVLTVINELERSVQYPSRSPSPS